MAANSSNAAGWLTPVGDEPTYDAGLEGEIKIWIQGVTALPADKVAANKNDDLLLPLDFQADSCLFSINKVATEGMSVNDSQNEHDAALWLNEIITCTVSFFGANGQLFASRLRDGNCLSQNQEELSRLRLRISGCDDIISSNGMRNNTQFRRHDMTIILKRKIVRYYDILSLVEAPVSFYGE